MPIDCKVYVSCFSTLVEARLIQTITTQQSYTIGGLYSTQKEKDMCQCEDRPCCGCTLEESTSPIDMNQDDYSDMYERTRSRYPDDDPIDVLDMMEERFS